MRQQPSRQLWIDLLWPGPVISIAIRNTWMQFKAEDFVAPNSVMTAK